MIRRLRLLTALGGVAALGVSSGCGADAQQTTRLAVPHVYELDVDAAAGIAAVDPHRGAVLTAQQLRNVIDQQLAWHGVTLVEMMRAARAHRGDLQVWIDQVSQNTVDLTATIGVAYGPVAARAFNQQWAQHTQFLLDYADAVGRHDTEAAAEAGRALAEYAADSGHFFATATAGGLSAGAVQTLLDTHVAHMLAMLDADQAGDVNAAVTSAVTDSAHLSTIAGGLSAAIAAQSPTAFPGSTDTPTAELCSIVAAGTSGYLSSLLITGDPSSSAVLNATQGIADATGFPAASILDLGTDITGPATPAKVAAGKAALAAANAFALDHA